METNETRPAQAAGVAGKDLVADLEALIALCSDTTKRMEAVLILEQSGDNPNGDPDQENRPRTLGSGRGVVSSGSLKRKIRDFADRFVSQFYTPENKALHQIYIRDRSILGDVINKLYASEDVGFIFPEPKKPSGYDDKELAELKKKKTPEQEQAVWKKLLQTFWDNRVLGAVLNGGLNAGQVTGAFQVCDLFSADEIDITEIPITSMVLRKDDLDNATKHTMGRRQVSEYGLYLGHIYFSPFEAAKNGVSNEDCVLFWRSLILGLDNFRTASRNGHALRGLYVYVHDNPCGNARAHVLLDMVSASLVDEARAPVRLADYVISAPTQADMPKGVNLVVLADAQ